MKLLLITIIALQFFAILRMNKRIKLLIQEYKRLLKNGI